MRRISVFGSTGSIGVNTLELIARAPEAYKLVALTGGRNVALLAQQAYDCGAEIAVTAHDDCLSDLRAALAGTGIEAAAGRAALIEAAHRPADWTMNAIVGAAGLEPGFTALQNGAMLALANKESLVTAGPLLMQTARDHGATILPVDSEHSAIFQCLTGEDISRVERIILTASGGALRDWPLERLSQATVKDALAHPNWDMGARITIDSASMFNKALEVIETREYFGIDPGKIEVILHPESIIHSMVGFVDGAVMAHLGAPDMRHAIGYALHYPTRAALPVERLDLARLGGLTFRTPDYTRFPALRLARQVMEVGGLAGAAFNAAKEIALDHFIAGGLRFTQMATVVEDTLDMISRDCGLGIAPSCLEKVLEMDQVARIRAAEAAQRLQQKG